MSRRDDCRTDVPAANRNPDLITQARRAFSGKRRTRRPTVVIRGYRGRDVSGAAGRAGRIVRPAELPDRPESLGLSPHERVGWEGQVKPLGAPLGCLLRLTPHLVEANDPLEGQALPNRGDVGGQL